MSKETKKPKVEDKELIERLLAARELVLKEPNWHGQIITILPNGDILIIPEKNTLKMN